MAHDRPLWAPWRIEFIRSEKDSTCFLCDNPVVNPGSQEEELIVFRGETCFIILNRYPYNSGHLLIAPYRHIGDIAELPTTELHEIMDLTVLAKQVLSQTMNPDAFNAGLNLGVASGAGIADHVHMHIVPRWTGDTNFISVIDDVRVVPEALTVTAELLRLAFASE
ncbi:MAG: HIT domain-containing protein [Victivallaceae bacterium]|nr:HIT domain-containing protein [Victivallaceae bacterium]